MKTKTVTRTFDEKDYDNIEKMNAAIDDFLNSFGDKLLNRGKCCRPTHAVPTEGEAWDVGMYRVFVECVVAVEE